MLYQIDADYEEQAEKKSIIQLQEFFKFPFIKLDYYDTFDFYYEQQELYIQLKSRRCKIDTYDNGGNELS